MFGLYERSKDHKPLQNKTLTAADVRARDLGITVEAYLALSREGVADWGQGFADNVERNASEGRLNTAAPTPGAWVRFGDVLEPAEFAARQAEGERHGGTAIPRKEANGRATTMEGPFERPRLARNTVTLTIEEARALLVNAQPHSGGAINALRHVKEQLAEIDIPLASGK
jgi:hypothetical protein